VQRERLSPKTSGPKDRSTICLQRKLSCVFEKEYACLLHPNAVPFDEEYRNGYAKTPQDLKENALLRRELLPLQKQNKLLYFYTLKDDLSAFTGDRVSARTNYWFSRRLRSVL
jgi:hypothetical protein